MFPVGHLEFGCNRDLFQLDTWSPGATTFFWLDTWSPGATVIFFQLDTWSPGATAFINFPVGHLEFGCNRDSSFFQLDTWSSGATEFLIFLELL